MDNKIRLVMEWIAFGCTIQEACLIVGIKEREFLNNCYSTDLRDAIATRQGKE